MDKLPAWSGAPERTACCLSKTTLPGRRPRETKRSDRECDLRAVAGAARVENRSKGNFYSEGTSSWRRCASSRATAFASSPMLLKIDDQNFASAKLRYCRLTTRQAVPDCTTPAMYPLLRRSA